MGPIEPRARHRLSAPVHQAVSMAGLQSRRQRHRNWSLAISIRDASAPSRGMNADGFASVEALPQLSIHHPAGLALYPIPKLSSRPELAVPEGNG